MEKIDFYMRDFLKRLDHESVFEYYDKINHGKRLRSKLMLNICENEKIHKLCAIIECIHLASLLHDDVIDGADTRRGMASINAIFGDKSAIMLGDILYSSAFYELCEFDKEIMRIVSNAVSVLSSGELMDMELSASFNPNITKYLEMIYRKTAVLIEASAKSAAILAGKNPEKYAIYGKNLGMAFQIIDDLLDVSVDSATLGKPCFADFSEGKTSLPYIYLYECLGSDEKNELLGYFGIKPSEKIKEWIKSKMTKYGIYEKVKQKAMEYANQAKNSLDENADKKLNEVLEKMIFRNF